MNSTARRPALAAPFVTMRSMHLAKTVSVYCRRRVLIVFVLLFVCFAKGQTGVHLQQHEQADSILNAFMEKWKIRGGSVALTKNGKLIYNKGFGYSDEDNTPAGPKDLYRIASVSKPITSMAVMKLVESGRIALDDTVFGSSRILRQSYYLDRITDDRIYNITVRHLLEHTAGWDRKVPCDNYSFSDPAFFPLHVTETESEPNPVGDSTLIRFSLAKGLQFTPGSRYSYSNIGYLILGKVIEAVSGTDYETFVKSNIFWPLAIFDVGIGQNEKERKHPRETHYASTQTNVSCYGNGELVLNPYGGFNVEAMNAHGGWVASAPDLAKLLVSLGDETSSILSPLSIYEMTRGSSANPRYAKGWSVNQAGNWWHTGSLDGSSAFICKTKGGYTWAFLFNSRGDNSAAFWQALDRLPWKCIAHMDFKEELNFFPPEVNGSGLIVDPMNPGTAHLILKKGSGDGRLVVVSEGREIKTFPVDGKEYIADQRFGKGARLDEKTFVVHAGDQTQVIIRNLDPARTYSVTSFEYYRNDSTAMQPVYQLSAAETLIFDTHASEIINP